MDPDKSLDDSKTIIAALLHDVHNAHGLVFNKRSLRLTLNKVNCRLSAEGIGFLTKTLPRLAKAFDKALAGVHKFDAKAHGCKTMRNSELPRFLGEFFELVFQTDGAVLQQPCANCVRVIRQILYLFYKYELPYSDEQEQQVLEKFERTDQELIDKSALFEEIRKGLPNCYKNRLSAVKGNGPVEVVRRARSLLERLFLSFDPRDIYPRHGPGAVATKQRLWGKYQWTNVAARITDYYPFDEYFCSSQGHVCDSFDKFSLIGSRDLPARVILVPKDSRGPRLISCEPVDFQWVQQGLGQAIVKLVESHPLTKWNVHFTDQLPNQFGALLGSKYGKYSTLDLNEASDRVSADLVRLLFPEAVYTALDACRSLSTELPSGRVIRLNKFAPMGSSLCFPILALTVWAILTASAPDADTRESILVYGDDVIVPTANAANAIEQLETFGLKVNRDKSCTSGFFRESCGTDAFRGVNVTPVRLRTVWSSTPSPDVYTSWIAYANSFKDRQYHRVYDVIVDRLLAVYGTVPSEDMQLACPSLRDVPEYALPKRRRYNKKLQKLQWYVWDVKAPSVKFQIDGWSMLLRYFAEHVGRPGLSPDELHAQGRSLPLEEGQAFSVGSYTDRKTSMLVRRWR